MVLKVGLFALILILQPLMLAFADSDAIFVSTDKQTYSSNDTMIISGTISKLKMSIIAMRIYDPDGSILSAHNLDIQDNSFKKTISLDSPFYEKSGKYTIQVDYGKHTEKIHFEIPSGQIQEEIFEQIVPEIVFLMPEKPIFYDGDTIVITGLMSSIESPTVLVGIYDTFGMPSGFYFGDIDSSMEFSISFLAKAGVNFKTEGTYSAIAHYADSEYQTFFDFKNAPEIIEETFDVPQIEPEIISETELEDVTSETTEPEIISETELEDVTSETTEPEIISEPKIISQPESPTKTESPMIKQNEKLISKPIDNENKNKENKITKTKPEEPSDPLSVEDIKLGKLLNHITLNCDQNEFDEIVSYYDGMGPALIRLCKYSEALSYFDESLNENPTDVEVLSNKGSALNNLEQYYEAITYFDLALAIDSEFIPAINNKANSLAQLGYYSSAASLYESALEIDPSFTMSQSNLKKIEDKLITTQPLIEQKIISVEQIPEQTTQKEIPEPPKPQNTKQPNFFEEIGNAFSSFFSIFS